MSQSTSVAHDGWELVAHLRNGPAFGGLTLSDVRHAQYLLARDIRVVRVWAGSASDPDPSTGAVLSSYVLGSAQFPNVEPIQESLAPAAGLLAPYPQVFQIASRFKTTGPVVGKGQESQPLALTQRYVFTKYGKNPPHEPVGVLPAARLYPLVEFSYTGSEGEFKPLNYLRVDYRFEFTVEALLDKDRYEKAQRNLRLGEGRISPQPKSTAPGRQQAAVFLDIDVEPSALKGAGGILSGTSITDVFKAAEKPLPREMIGQGLKHGHKAQWDNLHVWGAQDPLPATPGAFHAAHVHWRWGKLAAEPTGFPLFAVGGAQFKGIGGAGGPLLDARIPSQHLRFAITGEPGGPWEANLNPSTRVFDDLFTGVRAQPNDISNGAEIVFWVSIEVFRSFENQKTNATWEGTLFPNGLYFAHDPELTPVSVELLQLNKPMHVPGTSRGWVRP
jgi:hypothetical protein